MLPLFEAEVENFAATDEASQLLQFRPGDTKRIPGSGLVGIFSLSILSVKVVCSFELVSLLRFNSCFFQGISQCASDSLKEPLERVICALHTRSHISHSGSFRLTSQAIKPEVKIAEAAAITQLEYLVLAMTVAKDTATARSTFSSLVEVVSSSRSPAVAKSVCTAIVSCVVLLDSKYFGLTANLFISTAVRNFGN
jgi:hypothetical protein